MWSSPEGSTKYFPSVPVIKTIIFLAFFSPFLFYRTKNTCNFLTGDNWLIGKNVPARISIIYIYMYILDCSRGEERRFNGNWYQTRIWQSEIFNYPRYRTARYSYTRALDEYNAVLINRLARMRPNYYYKVGKVERILSIVHLNVLSNSFYRIRARSSNIRGKFYRVCIVLDEDCAQDSFRYPL